jgi:hypothetical protein
MPTTYEPIATTTLSTTTATVTFSSISGTYTDLILVANPLADANNYNFNVRYNSDTGNNYSSTSLRFNSDESASPQSTRTSNTSSIITNTNINTTTPFPIIYQILNYSNTTTNKTSISRISRGDYAVAATVGLWRNTGAITSISCILTGGGSASFVSGSTFTIYGIKAA